MKSLVLSLLVMVAITSLTGCAASSETPPSWSFSVAAPEHYRVWVEHLELEKSGVKHWRMPIGGVDCCWRGSDGPSGPGGPITVLPNYIGIQWFSFSEQKYYQRRIPVPDDLKQRMEKPATYSGANGEHQAPRDMFVVGLAPGGTIVLWIMNQIGNEVEVARMQANEFGGDPNDYRAATKRYLKENGDYLKQHGVPTSGW
ncbi:DUF2931 family protein [Marinobacter sp. NFXS9]|uniref:DUF2931 family protein n=1 Tax=Marinobacter sp. NFXS9 TaxID=2818433 RepID=UPI0032DE68B5